MEISKEMLLKKLETIRYSICVYHSKKDSPCDCKFSLSDEDTIRGKGEYFSGCCELRAAIHILKGVSSSRFKEYF
jgi:hypothetical protein